VVPVFFSPNFTEVPYRRFLAMAMTSPRSGAPTSTTFGLRSGSSVAAIEGRTHPDTRGPPTLRTVTFYLT
jgi:hypothetical protein